MFLFWINKTWRLLLKCLGNGQSSIYPIHFAVNVLFKLSLPKFFFQLFQIQIHNFTLQFILFWCEIHNINFEIKFKKKRIFFSKSLAQLVDFYSQIPKENQAKAKII